MNKGVAWLHRHTRLLAGSWGHIGAEAVGQHGPGHKRPQGPCHAKAACTGEGKLIAVFHLSELVQVHHWKP